MAKSKFLNDIRKLIGAENEALRTNDFQKLERIAGAKEVLLADGVLIEGEATAIAELVELAEENQQLLDASREGISAALRKLSEASALPSELSTYDQRGKRRHGGAPAGNLTKKA